MPSDDRPPAESAAPAAQGAPPSGGTPAAEEPHERHASWLELFFDLVVIAAVAQLVDRLHGDPSPVDVGLAVVLYVALWLVWTSFMLYANVSSTQTRQQSMLAGMAGIAVMAAAIPQATGSRATAFTLAYIATRVAGMRSWARTGQTLLSWPAAQLSAGLTPWIVSLWLDPPVRYWLWGLGVIVDLVPSVWPPGTPTGCWSRCGSGSSAGRSGRSAAGAAGPAPPKPRGRRSPSRGWTYRCSTSGWGCL